MNWDHYKKAFKYDGGLIDVFVLETGIHDWQKFLDFIFTGELKFKFSVDGVETPVPRDAAALLNLGPDESTGLLSIDLNGPIANCHFFTEKVIELDLDPREIIDETRANSIFDFMKQIVAVLNKDVILSPENSDLILFRFDAGTGEMTYVEPGVSRYVDRPRFRNN